MAIQQKFHKEILSKHRYAWLARGIKRLCVFQPRCGAPRKLSETHQQLLCPWAKEGACTATQFRTRLSEEQGAGHGEFGAERHEIECLRLEKNSAQFKNRDEAKFREAEAEIEELIENKAWQTNGP